ncbi:preprotein translocase subunit SecE [Methylobacterium sp. NEAU K]|uniref:preprotein translocase subunit SecE n=1 Tax=Methylobacterium sp. NEAU K TaxID=3064946 RepID=UPI002733C7B1|nr:preprotein translocase subunit SecE [Methylobacterium sp. NEAU K]MDP4005428.1 preprotein translocase subunit SecE [Methylobacterium sp. NEAU K]
MASNEATKKVDLARGAARGPVGTPPARPATPARVPQKRATPGEFIAQVRDEARKVTWPSRRETTITTIMVFVMVVVTSLFFTVVDQALRFVVGLVLGL